MTLLSIIKGLLVFNHSLIMHDNIHQKNVLKTIRSDMETAQKIFNNLINDKIFPMKVI